MSMDRKSLEALEAGAPNFRKEVQKSLPPQSSENLEEGGEQFATEGGAPAGVSSLVVLGGATLFLFLCGGAVYGTLALLQKHHPDAGADGGKADLSSGSDTENPCGVHPLLATKDSDSVWQAAVGGATIKMAKNGQTDTSRWMKS